MNADIEDGQTVDEIEAEREAIESKPTDGRTSIDLYRDDSGGWEATQRGIDLVGEGDLAARAVEDFARQVAEEKEAEDHE